MPKAVAPHGVTLRSHCSIDAHDVLPTGATRDRNGIAGDPAAAVGRPVQQRVDSASLTRKRRCAKIIVGMPARSATITEAKLSPLVTTTIA